MSILYTSASGATPVDVVILGGPSATDWIAAVTGALALAIGVLAVYPAWRGLRMQREDREREQASKFAMWAQFSESLHEMQVFWFNSGSGPVYDVKGKLFVGTEEIVDFQNGTMGPVSSPQLDPGLSTMLRSRIESRLQEEFGGEASKMRSGSPTHSPAVLLRRVELNASVAIEVGFRDASGVRWLRASDGKLTRSK
jgi:hypothetical protein